MESLNSRKRSNSSLFAVPKKPVVLVFFKVSFVKKTAFALNSKNFNVLNPSDKPLK